MLGQTYQLHELHAAILEKELSRNPVSTYLAPLPYHKQQQQIAMVWTPGIIKHVEQTSGYALYFTQLVASWRTRQLRLVE
jgi:hypothetical protein